MSGNRWCETCQRGHGDLYICKHYPESLKQELKEHADKLRANMMRPGWVQEQLDKDIPIEAIAIMGQFMGLELYCKNT